MLPVTRFAAEIFFAHPRLTSKRLASWAKLPSPRSCAVSSFLRKSFEYACATFCRSRMVRVAYSI
jgi:hypothetical protein